VHGKSSLLGKMPGERDDKFANQRTLFGYMFAHPGKKLMFMGGEWGQWGEWDYDGELEWSLLQYAPHQQLQRYVFALNDLYRAEPALHQVEFDYRGFEWIERLDSQRSVIAFVRWARRRREFIVAVVNFTPVTWRSYELPVPRAGAYVCILNSDDERFGGRGTRVGDATTGRLHTERRSDVPAGRRSGHETTRSSRHRLTLDLPPLGVLWLKPAAPDDAAG